MTTDKRPADRAGNENANPVSKRAWIALLIICLISFAGHLACLPFMPEQIPTHFGAGGEVNGWTDKMAAIPLFAMPMLMLLVLYAVPNMDPRGGAYKRMGKFYLAFVTVLTLFMNAVMWMSELSVFGLLPQGESITVIMGVLLGAIFVMMGNYLPKVKRNYTFGIKTPWALDSDENWRLTHRFAGVVFVIAGVITMASALLAGLLGTNSTTIMLVALLGGSLLAFAYSYLAFRHGNKPLRAR